MVTRRSAVLRVVALSAFLAGCNAILGIASDYHHAATKGSRDDGAPDAAAGDSGSHGGGVPDSTAPGAGNGGVPGVANAGSGGATQGGGAGGSGGTLDRDASHAGGAPPGAGGVVATGPTGTVGQRCAQEGARACAGNAQPERLVCKSEKWASDGSCPANSNCSTGDPNPGSCIPIVAECAGKAPGTDVCNGQDVETCGPDLVTVTTVEICRDQACVNGGCQGCGLRQTRCNGTTPQSCDADGLWQDGVVTQGKCNAACTPATTRCVSLGQQQTCSPSGSWGPSVDCMNQTCVGTGVGSKCMGVCSQGQTQCQGSSVQSCTPAGSYGPAMTCSAPQVCTGKDCACPSSVPELCNGNCTSYMQDKFNCGSCGHSCQGGSCSDGVCQPLVLTTGVGTALSIAVTSSGVLWTDSTSAGVIYRVPLGGGMFSVVGSLGGSCGVRGLVADATNAYGFATSSSPCLTLASATLKSVPLAGGSAVTLATVSGLYDPPWRFLAVSDSGLFFTDFDRGELYQVAKSGGTVTTLWNGGSQYAPSGVTVQGDSVYWDDSRSGVRQLPVSGGTAPVVLAPANGSGFIAADSAFVYYTNSDAVMKASTAGSTPVTLAPSGAKGPLVIDTNDVFYLGASTVMMVPKKGGAAVTLASNQTSPIDIAVDAVSVYWLTSSAVMKVAK